ncbi:MAG: tRNA lysidine(34) synthetase TilS [Spirochaetes bacterium]|nr:tRNA lysidine(34) synthetase TilS [Spirochaetota bacterium]
MSLTKKNHNNFKQRISDAFKRLGVPAGGRLLVGFSGGPDSTFLLYLLSKLKQDWNFELFAAYIDHGMRSKTELREETRFVKSFSGEMGVPLYIERIPEGDIRKGSAAEGISVEEYARNRRYSLFKGLALKVKASRIVLGHNYDDQIETIIMRFFQGSNFSGLSGIPEKRDIIIRPLINFSKSEILGYLKEHNIPFSVDSTNLKTDYLRNKVRHKLMPVISEVFPGYDTGIQVFSEKMKVLKEFSENEILHNKNIKICNAGYKIDGSWFVGLPGFLRIEIVYYLFDKMMSSDKIFHKRIPYRFLRILLDKDMIQKRKIIIKGYGFKLSWKKRSLFWERDVVYDRKKGYFIVIKKNIVYDIDFLHFSITLSEDIGNTVCDEVLHVDSECLNEPVILRSWKDGDKIKVRRGARLIKKIFQELKIPEFKRDLIPLITDREGIKLILAGPLGYDNIYGYNIKSKKSSGDKLNIMIKYMETGNSGR